MNLELIEKIKGDRKAELRKRNIEEINRFDWINWSEPSMFNVLALNAFLSTMGMTGPKTDVENMVKYVFGEAELDKRTGNTGFTIEYGLFGGKFRTAS